MLNIVSTLIAIALLFSSGSGLAAAGEVRPFDRAAFMEAQSAGSSIVVWVHAPW